MEHGLGRHDERAREDGEVAEDDRDRQKSHEPSAAPSPLEVGREEVETEQRPERVADPVGGGEDAGRQERPRALERGGRVEGEPPEQLDALGAAGRPVHDHGAHEREDADEREQGFQGASRTRERRHDLTGLSHPP